MPNIYLGPKGEETLLPPVNWMAGGELELPIGYAKNVDKVATLSGATRANFKTYTPKTFELSWDLLPAATITTLRGLAELNQKLSFQNNWLDATWRWVYVASLEVSSIQSTHAATAQYKAVLQLEEVV